MSMDKLKILIAEDDRVIQMFYKEGLKEDVFVKIIVDNGEEALRVYANWKPDIVLLDIKMPIKSGYEVLKEIRKRESFISESMKARAKKTAVIMATGMTKKNDILDCTKLGIQGYIIKPFEVEEIANIILNYYNKFQSSQK